MDMTGEFRIPAPRDAVWRALNDPEVLKQCIPGCETVEKTSDTEFVAKVTAAVGPVKAKFGGKVTLSDIDPPNGYTISGEGQGGAAGFAKGGAKVSLVEDAGGTLLRYQVSAQVGGKLAQVGSRLIDGVSKKMAEEFFNRFAAQVAEQNPPPAEPQAEAARPAEAPPAHRQETREAQQAQKAGLPGWAWIAGIVAAVGVLLLIFGRG
ncbi:MAG: carbon monoxide dehydrogenase subunit G [Rhodospirillales bacterium]|nr:carbon monoxide dehydrogenase subunit G [Rhodospirillales bacterium]